MTFFDIFCFRYGFRTPPHLELKARPKLGEREVTLAHVTDWIEKKLDQEFQVLTDISILFFLFRDDQTMTKTICLNVKL